MRIHTLLLLLLLSTGLAGCDLVGDLVEFGFWTAIIFVVILVALVAWVWKRISGRGRRP